MNEHSIFLAVREIDDPTERSAYLDRACAGDPDLRSHVEQLLHAHQELATPGKLGDTQGEPPADDTDIEVLGFLTPSDKPGVLGRLGRYEVLQVIGHGGMGIVLRASDEQLHRTVAIKVMAAHLATSATARKRFLREARTAAAVTHDHVVTIHAVEEARGLPYLVMKYVAGLTLKQRLNREGPLPLQEILRIGRETASGLAAAHARGLIHRDIKPANLLLEETQASGGRQPPESSAPQGADAPRSPYRVKITDFGLARAADDSSLTQSGMVAGTPDYMSPEQARGETLDARTDLFSLGSVLYAMCTGRAPFHAGDALAILHRVCEEAPTPIREINPAIPDWLAAIIDKLHAKDPALRFQSAAEVAEVLSLHLAHLLNPAVAPPPSHPASGEQKPSATGLLARQRRWAVAGTMLVLFLGGFALTEATSVTKLTATITRVFTSDATPFAEGNDPGVEPTGKGGGFVIAKDEPGWVQLFNGKDLTGWKPHPNWRVENGILVASGPTERNAMLMTERNDYQDFHLRVEVRILTQESDSGVLFRGGSGSVQEANIAFHPEKLDEQTGTLSLQQYKGGSWVGGRRFSAPPGLGKLNEWLTLEVIARGQHVITKVNGRTAVETYEAIGYRPAHISLQQHGAQTIVHFRKVEIKELPPEDPGLLASQKAATEKVGVIRQIEWPGRHIYQTAFSPDGRLFLVAGSAGPGHTIKVWEVATGRLALEFPGNEKGVFTPDGKQVLAAGLDKSLHLWDVATGQEVRKLAAHADWINTVALDPEGKRALASSNDGAVCWHDVTTGNVISEWKGAGGSTRAVLAPDGRRALTCTDLAGRRTLELWETASAQRLKSWNDAPSIRYPLLGFTPDAREFLTVAGDGVGYRNAADGELVKAVNWPAGLAPHLSALGLSPDCRRLLVPCDKGKKVCLLELPEGREVCRLDVPTAPYGAMAISPNGQYAVAADGKGAVYLFGLPEPRPAERATTPPVGASLADLHHRRGNLLREAQRLDDAASAYRKAVEVRAKLATEHPTERSHRQELGRNHNWLGIVLAQQGRTEEAEQAHREALGIYEKLTEETATSAASVSRWHRQELAWTCLNLGEAVEKDRRFTEAMEFYRRAGELSENLAAENPSDRVYSRPWACQGYGKLISLLTGAGRKDEAKEVCGKLLAFKPPLSGQSLNGVAWSLVSGADPKFWAPEPAVELAQKAVQLEPTAVHIVNTLGVAQYRAGDWKAAIETLKRADQLSNGRHFGHNAYFIAMARWRLEEKEQAHKWYAAAQVWMERLWIEKKGVLPGDDQQLTRFRAEAAALLGLPEQLSPEQVQARTDEAKFYTLVLDASPESVWAWAGRGNHYLAKNELARMAEDYTRAIELKPGESWYWHERGWAYLHLGEHSKAVADYTEVIRLTKDTGGGARERRGRAYQALGEFQKAEQDYSRAFELSPNLASTRDALARLLATCPDPKFRDPARAVELAKRAVELEPKAPAHWNTLGVAQYRAGDWKTAIITLMKSHEIGPQSFGANAYFLAMAHWQLEEKEQARKWYAAALVWMEKWKSRSDDLPRFRAEAASLLDLPEQLSPEQEQARDDDVKFYTLVLEVQSEVAWPYRYRAGAFAQRKEWDQAAADYSRIIDMGKATADDWNNRGVACSRLGQKEKALADYVKASELNPKGALCWSNRASVCAEMNRHDQAVADYSRAIELIPDNPDYWNRRGVVYSRLGQQDKALADYSRAMDLRPSEPLYRSNRGNVFAELGQWDKAALDFVKTIEFKEDDPQPRYRLALVRLQQGDRDEYRKVCAGMLERFGPKADPDPAYWTVWTCVLGPEAVSDWKPVVDLAEKALAADPENFDKLQLLGAVLYRAGRFEEAGKRLTEAEAAFQKAKNPRTPVIYTWLFQAMIQHCLGHAEEVRKWLDKAVEAIDQPPDKSRDAGAGTWNRRLTLQLWQRELAGACLKLGEALEKDRRLEEAMELYRRAGALSEKLALENPHSTDLSCGSQGYGKLAILLAAADRAQEADQACRKVLELKPDDPLAHFKYALLRLHLGGRDAYRTACADMLTRFGNSPDLDAAYWTAWTCTLAPDAVSDWQPILRLAEKALAADPKNCDKFQLLGAVLFRAERFKEALQRLTEAEAAYREAGNPVSTVFYNWLFQAMTRHRLGQAGEARKWLTKAVEAIDLPPEESRDPRAGVWNRRLTLQLWRREAQAQLGKD